MSRHVGQSCDSYDRVGVVSECSWYSQRRVAKVDADQQPLSDETMNGLEIAATESMSDQDELLRTTRSILVSVERHEARLD